MVNVILTDFGIGYRYGNNVEINRKLLQYPNLYRETMEHEMKHNADSLVDFWHDFKSLFSANTFDWVKFSVRNPKAFLQSSFPVWINKQGLCINSFLCFLYSGTIFLTISGIYLINKGGLL